MYTILISLYHLQATYSFVPHNTLDTAAVNVDNSTVIKSTTKHNNDSQHWIDTLEENQAVTAENVASYYCMYIATAAYIHKRRQDHDEQWLP